MIKDRIDEILTEIPENVSLIAVSKTKPISEIQEAIDAGQRIFGENKVQELCEKQEQLSSEIEWHFIGHLQSNKVKFIAPFVQMIHAVDSLKLLKEINKQAAKYNRVVDCLLQFRIASEETKFGLSFEDGRSILESNDLVEMQHVSIVGLMGMATLTSDEEQIRDEFRTLDNYFNVLKSHYFKFNPDFKHLSMGMSGDYKIAIEEGSTMIRVGSTIFGAR